MTTTCQVIIRFFRDLPKHGAAHHIEDRGVSPTVRARPLVSRYDGQCEQQATHDYTHWNISTVQLKAATSVAVATRTVRVDTWLVRSHPVTRAIRSYGHEPRESQRQSGSHQSSITRWLRSGRPLPRQTRTAQPKELKQRGGCSVPFRRFPVSGGGRDSGPLGLAGDGARN